MVHLGQLKKVLHVAGGYDRCLVVLNSLAPGMGDDVHIGEMAKDAGLRLAWFGIKSAAANKRFTRKSNSPRILHKAKGGGLPVQSFDGQPFVIVFKGCSGYTKVLDGFGRANETAIRLTDIEVDQSGVFVGAWICEEGRRQFQDRLKIAHRHQPLKLVKLSLACGQFWSAIRSQQKKADRLAGLTRDQLEGLK